MSAILKQSVCKIAARLNPARMTSKQFGVLVAAASLPLLYACWRLDPISLSGVSLVRFYAFFCLFAVVSLFPVRVASQQIRLSTILPISVATIYLYGAFAATSLAMVATLVTVVHMDWRSLSRRSEWRRVFWSALHNVPMIAIATGIPAFLVSFALHRTLIVSHSVYAAGMLCLASVMDFYISAVLLTTLVSLWYKMRWDVAWYGNFRWTLASTVLLSPLGFLMGALSEQNLFFGLAFILAPLIAIHQGYALHERRMTTYRSGIEMLGKLMQESHPYTHGHLNRVARWAVKIAEGLDLPAESLSHVENAAILHDIGKIALDDRILNKVEKLTDDEWARIKEHPVIGADIAARMKYLDQVALWIRHHHERIDGKGYPDGLAGEAIPIESRIICVVDAFDAMVGGPSKADQRPYREPKTLEEARAELVRCSGTQFDEKVVQRFLAVLQAEEDEARAALEAEHAHAAPRLTLVGAPTSSSDHTSPSHGSSAAQPVITLRGAA